MIGNIIYFISAYFAYSIFEEKFIDKLGAKLIYHSMFKWIQFQNSMIKLDTGLVVFLTLTFLIFDNKHTALVPTDVICLLLVVPMTFVMKKFIRDEVRSGAIATVSVRCILQCYTIFRIIDFITDDDKSEDFFTDGVFGEATVLIAGISDIVIIVIVVISTIVCVRNFGKGLKEMIKMQSEECINSERNDV